MPEAKNDADIWFDRLRWGWIGLAVSGVIIYLLNSDIRIQVMVEEDPSQEGIREAVDEEILGEGAADIEEDIEI
jgi:hypothetical protein